MTSIATAARQKALDLPDDFSLKLCAAVRAWRYEDLPASVAHMLKLFLIDTLGVIGGATHAPGIGALNRRLARWESSGNATGLVGLRRYSPPTAALANGAAAHALDFDDIHDSARVHTNCVMLPTLLATAQDIGAVSGKDFLLAMAIGAELHARFGLACFNSMAKGWHPTMVLGTLSASIAAAAMLRLDDEGICNALGFGYHQSSGSAQSMRDGVLSKRIGAGFAARAAVLSAFLAADGITGTRHSLEGNAGLFALYERDEVRPGLMFDGLGKQWHIDGYSFKPYPGCRCNHTSIGLGIKLHAQGIRADNIDTIEIRMSELNWLTVGAPYDVDRDSVAHAQFNVSYSLARALIDGSVGLDSYQPLTIKDAPVVALAKKIRVIADPGIDKTAMAPAIISIRLKNGHRIVVQGNTIKGDPDEPMTDDDISEKLAHCLAFGIGASKAASDRLAQTLFNLEQSPDAAQTIFSAFPPDAALRAQRSA